MNAVNVEAEELMIEALEAEFAHRQWVANGVIYTLLKNIIIKAQMITCNKK